MDWGPTNRRCAIWSGDEYLGTVEAIGEIEPWNPVSEYFKAGKDCLDETGNDVDWPGLIPHLVRVGKAREIKGDGELQYSTDIRDHFWIGYPALFMWELIGATPDQDWHAARQRRLSRPQRSSPGATSRTSL